VWNKAVFGPSKCLVRQMKKVLLNAAVKRSTFVPTTDTKTGCSQESGSVYRRQRRARKTKSRSKSILDAPVLLENAARNIVHRTSTCVGQGAFVTQKGCLWWLSPERPAGLSETYRSALASNKREFWLASRASWTRAKRQQDHKRKRLRN